MECRRYAALAPYGTHCPLCDAKDIVWTRERFGIETLFCAACDHRWSRFPSSIESVGLDAAFAPRAQWSGIERRH